jgi:hypothetical protein
MLDMVSSRPPAQWFKRISLSAASVALTLYVLFPYPLQGFILEAVTVFLLLSIAFALNALVTSSAFVPALCILGGIIILCVALIGFASRGRGISLIKPTDNRDQKYFAENIDPSYVDAENPAEEPVLEVGRHDGLDPAPGVDLDVELEQGLDIKARIKSVKSSPRAEFSSGRVFVSRKVSVGDNKSNRSNLIPNDHDLVSDTPIVVSRKSFAQSMFGDKSVRIPRKSDIDVTLEDKLALSKPVHIAAAVLEFPQLDNQQITPEIAIESDTWSVHHEATTCHSNFIVQPRRLEHLRALVRALPSISLQQQKYSSPEMFPTALPPTDANINPSPHCTSPKSSRLQAWT